MELKKDLLPHEALAVGIRSEIEAASFYARLLAKVKNILLQKKLEFLVFEEKKHRRILERLFHSRYGDKKLIIPDRSSVEVPVLEVRDDLTVLDMFKAALQAEKAAEEFYKKAQGRADEEGSRKMLGYLSRVERSHYFMIRSEIELLSRFPDYYDVADFHLGEDMFHVGP
jgi:rubrerythrin